MKRHSISTAGAFLSLVCTALVLMILISGYDNADARSKNSQNNLIVRLPALKPANPVTVSPNAKIISVTVKFVEGSKVRGALSRGAYSISSMNGVDISSALATLSPYLAAAKLRPLLEIPARELDSRREFLQLRSGRQLADMANYYTISVTESAEAETLINQLNALSEVEIAYLAPVPEVAGSFEASTNDFTGQQAYLRPAPDGVDADFAHTISGGDGAGVKVIDVEGGWLVSHEDIVGNPPFVTLGGQIADQSWRNHGTAVIGEIMGVDNGFGITGIAPGVQWGYSSIASQSTAGALTSAGNNLDPGDVVLIELHAPGPHYNFESRDDQLGYVCMEYWQANFDAISSLSAAGIIVCEAAGNGSENYDDVALYGTLFDTTSRNSHAIICGAGAPPSGAHGLDRSRLGFSNYGERVNLQGDGRGVMTTGYGSFFGSGSSEEQWYTGTFSGTSSASPIVTGSVAAFQGAYKFVNGFPMNADEMRTILTQTGSAQQGNTSEHIGPRPNLRAAIEEILWAYFTADTTVGPAPLQIQFTGSSIKTVSVWDWDFGDGTGSSTQSPSHEYALGGRYNVTLAVETDDGPFAVTRTNFVAAWADTVSGPQLEGGPGESVRMDVYINNTIPVYQLYIPVDWVGPLNMLLDSASVAGLRSSNMSLRRAHLAIGPQRSFELTADSWDEAAALAPGSGPTLSLFFTISANPASGINPVSFSGYGAQQPSVVSLLATYTPETQTGEISLCVMPGDANNSGAVNIADAIFLINMVFDGGPQPSPVNLGDANCNGSTNIADAVYIISAVFAEGPPPPCPCAP